MTPEAQKGQGVGSGALEEAEAIREALTFLHLGTEKEHQWESAEALAALDSLLARAEAAEREVERLREALEDIARGCSTWSPDWSLGMIERKARAALATPTGEETPTGD